jgi:glycosyltransferase involved in cell wall biosynthesis
MPPRTLDPLDPRLRGASPDVMKLSVIIPTLNEAGLLDRCLSSLAKLDFPREELEVLVVDNGSSDDTPAVVERLGARYVREAKRGPYACRNAGAQHASGDALLFTDSDCTFYPDWASRARGALTERRLDAVVGWSEGEGNSAVARYIQRRYEQNLSQKAEDRPILDTRNCAVRAEVFGEAGGFDDRFLDLSDELLGVKLASLGKRVGFDRRMRVRHLNPSTLSVLRSKQRRAGYYCHEVWQTYPHNMLREHFSGIERWEALCSLNSRPLRKALAAPLWATMWGSGAAAGVAWRCLPSATVFADYLWRAAHLEGRLRAALE